MNKLLFLILLLLPVNSYAWMKVIGVGDSPTAKPSWASSFHYWRLEETDAVTRTDSGDHGSQDCSLDSISNVTQSSTRQEGSYSGDFEKNTNSYAVGTNVTCKGVNHFGKTNNAYTIGAWVYPETINQSSSRIIDMGFAYLTNGASTDANIRCTPATGAAFETSGGLANGTWTHAVCRMNSSSCELYTNGAYSTNRAGDCDSASNTGYTYAVGYYSNTTDWDGIIDEPFVFEGDLTAVQIASITCCQIDGARCKCSTADPTKYFPCGTNADCTGEGLCNSTAGRCTGRSNTVCGNTANLPSCNAAAP